MSLSPTSPTLRVAEPAHAQVATLFREHADFVFRVVRRLGVADRDADDVVQEVFLVVHRRIGDYEPRSTLRAWIYGIAVRTAYDYRKRAPRRREVLGAETPEPSVDHTPYDAAVERQHLTALDAALETLDDDKRAVFVLHAIEELTMAEVCTALGCPLQTAYTRFYAARTALVRHLRPEPHS